MFAKIIQRRLQVLVEDVVADSQCGFRSGRGCADMVFCARQLVEKAIEHNTKVFLLFVDLHKAYDSVPRSAMWLALQKYGVPDVTVDLVRGLHEHMEATVSVAGESARIQGLYLNIFMQYCNIIPQFWFCCKYILLIIHRFPEDRVHKGRMDCMRRRRIQGTVLTSGITFVNPCIQHFQS